MKAKTQEGPSPAMVNGHMDQLRKCTNELLVKAPKRVNYLQRLGLGCLIP